MKREAKSLLDKSIESLIVAIEQFNKPSEVGRVSSVLIMFDHAFEMLLKASIVHKGGRLREPGDKHAIGFDKCLRIALSDGAIKFIDDDQALTLQALNGLRDAAQHHLLDLSEEQLYVHAQAGMTLYRDIAKAVFGLDIAMRLPRRVLPLSTVAPTDIHALFGLQVEEIVKLLAPGQRKGLEVRAKMRPLAILDAAIRGAKGQPSDKELADLTQQLAKGKPWHEVFPGVAAVRLTATGHGPTLDLRLTKKSGVEVTLVAEGSPGAAVVAVKRVNELDFYNLSATQVAENIGVTVPKAGALIWHLDMKADADCYKQITIGKSKFDRYSQRAIEKLSKFLKTADMDSIWSEYQERVVNAAKAKRRAAKQGAQPALAVVAEQELANALN